MNIAYLVSDRGIPVLGRKGCSTHVRETSRGLIASGHKVRTYATNRGHDIIAEGALDIVETPAVHAKWLGADLRMLLNSHRLLRVVREDFRRTLPDVIYERYSLYGYAGHTLVREFNLPRILEVNAHLVEEQRHRLHWPWLAQRYEDYLLRHAEALIVVSQPLKASFIRKLRLPEDRISIMPMAVDIHRFRPDIPPRDLRAETALRKAVLAGYVGTLTEWHGVDMFYEVARRFANAGVDCGFVIVGGDPRQVENCRQRVREEGLNEMLRFVGSVPYEEVPSYLSAMDITVITNSTEFASPTKLFEYQAMAKPSVAPSLTPIREALTDNVEGRLFPPGDVAGLAEAILDLIRSPQRRRDMGLRARERVVRTHSWEVNVERITALYKKLLDRRRIPA